MIVDLYCMSLLLNVFQPYDHFYYHVECGVCYPYVFTNERISTFVLAVYNASGVRHLSFVSVSVYYPPKPPIINF